MHTATLLTALLGAPLAAAIVSREVVTIRKTVTETIHAQTPHTHPEPPAGYNPINDLPVTKINHVPETHPSAGWNPINDLPVTKTRHSQESHPPAGYNPVNGLPVEPSRHVSEHTEHKISVTQHAENPHSEETSHPVSTTNAAHPAQHRIISNPPAVGNDYASIALYHHNIHRSNHSSPSLNWSDSLAQIANEIASTCVYAHNLSPGGGGYGQNIAAGTLPSDISAVITDMFYNGEEPYYRDLYGQAQPNMGDFEHWGHFSQLVWKSTTAVGCATVHCPNGLGGVGSDVSPWFTVCNYKPPGNMAGEYGSNVLRPLGHAAVRAV